MGVRDRRSHLHNTNTHPQIRDSVFGVKMEALEKAAWSLASKFKSGGPGTNLDQDYIVRVAILVSHPRC